MLKANEQIKIQYTGTYILDDGNRVVDPLVIATSALDDFISSVTVGVLFDAPTYSYSRIIGSFTYSLTWGNIQVEDFINNYMNAHKA